MLLKNFEWHREMHMKRKFFIDLRYQPNGDQFYWKDWKDYQFIIF